MSRSACHSIRMVLVLALASVSPAQGQRVLTGTMTGPDSLLTLVAVRPREEVIGDLRRAEQRSVSAEVEIARAKALRPVAEGRRKVLEAEIRSIKQRLDLAKKEKREGDKRGLEIELDVAELAKKLFEEREALREAEIDLGESRRDQARALKKGTQLEMDLLDRREERDRAMAGRDPIAASRQERVIRELESQVLQAFRDLARRDRDEADKWLKVVERQIKLHEAQTKLVGQE